MPTTKTTPAQERTDVRVQISDLRKAFRRRSGAGDVVPINNVSLSIHTGEFLVLLGPSGCGKTTLLRSIAGLERPDSGKIMINQARVYDSEARIFVPPNRRPVSMIFQSYALWPHMTVFKNIAYPIARRGRGPGGRERVRHDVEQVLERVGLSGLGDQYPGQLSGGQQQRVALARALITDAEVILFDEPLSNVDAKVREELRAQLVEMQRELGFTAIYVTHDQAEAMELADRIAVLADGRIEQLARPREVYQRPSSRYVARFIGSANLYEGSVESVTKHRVTVSTTIGVIEVQNPRGSAPPVGSATMIMTRPEDCVITDQKERPNTVMARLLRASFTGTGQHALLMAGDQRIQATVGKDVELVEGTEVAVRFPAERICLLPADDGHDDHQTAEVVLDERGARSAHLARVGDTT